MMGDHIFNANFAEAAAEYRAKRDPATFDHPPQVKTETYQDAKGYAVLRTVKLGQAQVGMKCYSGIIRDIRGNLALVQHPIGTFHVEDTREIKAWSVASHADELAQEQPTPGAINAWWDRLRAMGAIPAGAARAGTAGTITATRATPFVWRDPLTIPPRPWVYGHHMSRKQASVTVAPGGVGKSSLTIVEGLAMATGRKLLGEWVSPDPLRVWLFNLEDPRDELDRRVIAAMMHHGIAPDDLGDRLFLDTGREQELCTAIGGRDGVTIMQPQLDALADEITARRIDVLIIDPFVSSHRVDENTSGAIDLVAKEWARLADRCNCAIELVHHTRKTNGAEATSEDGRGSSALLAAARSGRVLNKMADGKKSDAGVKDDPSTYFSIDRDKANLAPEGKRSWIRMASVDLGQGDSVGVAEEWDWPDTPEGVTPQDLLRVQQAIDGKQLRYSDQANGWVGEVVASVLGLDLEADRKRIKRMIEAWLKNHALKKVVVEDVKRNKRPIVEVDQWACL